MALLRILPVVFFATLTAGCSLAAGIFKAGFWTGIIITVVIIVGLMMLLRKRG
jgi:hypothetical protein